MMREIAFIGVGLIGGSLALAIKNTGKYKITGYDINEQNLYKGVKLGIIDQYTTSLKEAVEGKDIIFLCAPVGQLESLIREIENYNLKKGVIITDTGSTKALVVAAGRNLLEKEAIFIGGHPMAGSHKSGVEAADNRLFENAYYVLTPTKDVPDSAILDLSNLLSATKAKVLIMDSQNHDEIVGAISHFPHMIAALLVNQVAKYREKDEWYFQLAAGGFRDITRIASSNPVMWRDILLQNKEILVEIANQWKEEFDILLSSLLEGSAEQIEVFFSKAKAYRNQIPEKKTGAISALLDLYIDVPDHPGVIGKITTLLGEEKISITNIQILEVREDIMGVLRVTFRREEDLEMAKLLLTSRGYHVYIAH